MSLTKRERALLTPKQVEAIDLNSRMPSQSAAARSLGISRGAFMTRLYGAEERLRRRLAATSGSRAQSPRECAMAIDARLRDLPRCPRCELQLEPDREHVCVHYSQYIRQGRELGE